MDISILLGYLNKEIPASFACSWDNSGLQVGRHGKDVNRVYVALDATEDVVDDAISKNCDFILTHHPLLFKGVKQITSDTATGRKLLKLIANDVAVFSAHTSFDAVPGGMADLAGILLQLEQTRPLEPMNGKEEEPWGIGIVGNLPQPMTLKLFCQKVKDTFALDHINLFAGGHMQQPVRRIAICPGSGRSLTEAAEAAEADIFLTGDIGHHEGLDLVEQGISVIDAGHFGLEKIFIPVMADRISQAFPLLEVFTAAFKAPFEVL